MAELLVEGSSAAVTVHQECMQALRRAGASIMDNYDVVIVRLAGRRFNLDRWRFNLFCVRVHDRTPHDCAVDGKLARGNA